MTHQLFQLPKQTQIDASVRVTPGAKANFYATTTVVPQDTYTTSALSVAHPNPVVADANGVFPAIYLDPSLLYKLTLTTAADVLIYTVDPCNDQVLTTASIVALLTQAALGLILYRRTDAESAAGVTPTAYFYPPMDVRRYGADSAGVADSAQSIRDSLAAYSYAYLPPGYYKVGSTISLTGVTVVVVGATGGGHSGLATGINYTGTGSLFSAVGTEFGSMYIGHLGITGGSGDGAYCITSTRPQSLIEFVHMEGDSGYDNPGIQLSSASQGSWNTSLRHCKWVGTVAQTAFRGFSVDVDGGNVDLYYCIAIRGSVGCDFLKGEVVRLHKCNFNLQSTTYSSESAANGQMCVRATGAGAKKSLKIDSCYLEGSTTSVLLETAVEGASIVDCFIDDLGNSAGVGVDIRAAALNVTIQGGHFRNRSAGAKNVVNAGTNVKISNVLMNANGSAASKCIDNTGSNLITELNRLTCHAGGDAVKTTTKMLATNDVIVTGLTNDASGLIQYMSPSEAAFTAAVVGNGTAGTYEIASQNCNYTSVGRRVWVDIDITLAGAITGGGTGDLTITGLPFTKIANTLPIGTATFVGVDFAGTYVNVGFSSSGTSTALNFYQTLDNGALSFTPISGVAAGDTIRASICYRF